jgi:hypothetical protein
LRTWPLGEQSEPIENGRYLITFLENEIPKVIETEFKDGLWYFGSHDEHTLIWLQSYESDITARARLE